jgi:hypothetical protein
MLNKIFLGFRQSNIDDTHISWYINGNLTPKINIHLIAYELILESHVILYVF